MQSSGFTGGTLRNDRLRYHTAARLRPAGRALDPADEVEEPGTELEELARTRVDVAVHAVERREDREIGAARAVAEEVRARAEQAQQIVEAPLELGSGPAVRRVEDLGAELPVVADQPEPRQLAEAALRVLGIGRQHPAPDPAHDVEVERLRDPRLEPALLARDARILGEERRLREALVEEIEDRGRVDRPRPVDRERGQEPGLGVEAPVVLDAGRLDQAEAELLQAKAARDLHGVGREVLAVQEDLGLAGRHGRIEGTRWRADPRAIVVFGGCAWAASLAAPAPRSRSSRRSLAAARPRTARPSRSGRWAAKASWSRELVPEFERRNPGLRVRVQQIPWSAAHEKLLTAYVGESLARRRAARQHVDPGARRARRARAARRADRRRDGVAARRLLRGRPRRRRSSTARRYGAAVVRRHAARSSTGATSSPRPASATPPRTWGAWMEAMARVQARGGDGRYARPPAADASGSRS